MAERPTQLQGARLQAAPLRAVSSSRATLPFNLAAADQEKLEKISEASLPLKKGTHIFHQGDPFMSIFTVRAGTLKTYTVTNEGEEQITGFYFPGEIVALGSIGTPTHGVSAKALETTTVYEYSFEALQNLSTQVPELRDQLMAAMAKEIRNEQHMMLLLSKKTAEQRVATFLYQISERFRLRGYSATIFRLTMSRNEIGNYLGLAVETVSRIFTRFQKQQLINVEGKEIEILNLETLFEVSGDRKSEDSPH